MVADRGVSADHLLDYVGAMTDAGLEPSAETRVATNRPPGRAGRIGRSWDVRGTHPARCVRVRPPRSSPGRGAARGWGGRPGVGLRELSSGRVEARAGGGRGRQEWGELRSGGCALGTRLQDPKPNRSRIARRHHPERKSVRDSRRAGIGPVDGGRGPGCRTRPTICRVGEHTRAAGGGESGTVGQRGRSAEVAVEGAGGVRESGRGGSDGWRSGGGGSENRVARGGGAVDGRRAGEGDGDGGGCPNWGSSSGCPRRGGARSRRGQVGWRDRSSGSIPARVSQAVRKCSEPHSAGVRESGHQVITMARRSRRHSRHEKRSGPGDR